MMLSKQHRGEHSDIEMLSTYSVPIGSRKNYIFVQDGVFLRPIQKSTLQKAISVGSSTLFLFRSCQGAKIFPTRNSQSPHFNFSNVHHTTTPGAIQYRGEAQNGRGGFYYDYI